MTSIGSCLGPFIDGKALSDADECRDACKTEELCKWWTYNNADQFCSLLGDCVIRDETCDDCVFGHETCPDYKEGKSATCNDIRSRG